ncbi:polymerase/histidinol phosphatase-like protein [Halteromyces radiatus]|uniref:polymerase/histidinol phosphatase-like protein n=1 Tax=Halteromyces radiatus TaxID=101107 RepID=UPI00221F55C2|nr:polymerase/histidinol phosphatase-like protein [Halteromyces radiatus]KAI8093276.1 polymerase/histidinol phosphatase-like protein [Halteromyces radiatus]
MVDASPLLLTAENRRSWYYTLLNTLRPSRTYLLGFLTRFLTLVIILAVLIAIGLGLRYTEDMPKPEDFSQLEFNWQVNPSSYLTPYNQSFQYNVLLDGHSHSTYSDGKMNVKQLLDWHIANGYNAVMVTDHNTIAGGIYAEKLALQDEYYKERIVVIPGMEYSCCRIHMNLIGINQTIPVGPPVPSDFELQQVINKTHALGGIVIVNHIPWSNTTQTGYELPRLPNHPSVADLIAWGVDGFEVINQATFDYPTMQAAQQHNLIQMVGTDIHHPAVPANAWLTVNSPSMNKTAIMNEIIARRTSFLFDPTGTPERAYAQNSPSYDRLIPLTWLGDYFGMFYNDDKGMYSFQGTFCHPEQLTIRNNVIGWFIFWLIIFIIVFELVRTLVIQLSHHSLIYYRKRRSFNRE